MSSARRLGEQLLADGALTQERLRKALETQGLLAGRIGTCLLELGFLTEDSLLAALAKQRKVRTVTGADLAAIEPGTIKLISEKVAKRYRIVPFRLEAKALSIASADPEELLVQDEVAFLTGCRVTTFVALDVRMAEALERYYHVPRPRRLAALAQRLALRGGEGGAGAAPEPPKEKPAAPAPPAPPKAPAPSARPSAPLGEPEPFPFLKAGDETPTVNPYNFEESGLGEPPPRRPAPPPVLEIELGAEDAALFGPKGAPPAAEPTEPFAFTPPPPLPEPEAEPTAEPEPQTPEEALERAAQELQNAELRDEIADALLGFCARYFRRRALFIIRKDRIVGWYGAGDGVSNQKLRELDIPADEPSILHGLVQGQQFWLGPVPPMARNKDIVAALGAMPRDCVVVPVQLRGKAVSFLWTDNGAEGSVGGSPMQELRRLAVKAGVAFEVYILKNKIRTL